MRNPAPGMLQIGRKSENQQWRQNVLIWRHRQIFLVAGQVFMSLSLVVFDHKSGNPKYSCLRFAQYLETGAS